MPVPGGACCARRGRKGGGCSCLSVGVGALRSSRPVFRPGQAVAAAGHPFAAGGDGMMGCAVLVGGVNQSGDRAGLGVMTCTTRADLIPLEKSSLHVLVEVRNSLVRPRCGICSAQCVQLLWVLVAFSRSAEDRLRW